MHVMYHDLTDLTLLTILRIFYNQTESHFIPKEAENYHQEHIPFKVKRTGSKTFAFL